MIIKRNLFLKGCHKMIDVTQAAIDFLENYTKDEGIGIKDSYIRLYMAAG